MVHKMISRCTLGVPRCTSKEPEPVSACLVTLLHQSANVTQRGYFLIGWNRDFCGKCQFFGHCFFKGYFLGVPRCTLGVPFEGFCGLQRVWSVIRCFLTQLMVISNTCIFLGVPRCTLGVPLLRLALTLGLSPRCTSVYPRCTPLFSSQGMVYGGGGTYIPPLGGDYMSPLYQPVNFLEF